MIRQTVKYPREDGVELRDRLALLEKLVKRLEKQLNPETHYSISHSDRL